MPSSGRPCALVSYIIFLLTIKAYPRSYCYNHRFLCFDQSDFSCKISLILQIKKLDVDNFLGNFDNPLLLRNEIMLG